MKEKFRSIKCGVPKTIWPVLVHTKHQKLIENITLGKGDNFDEEKINPNISVRLPGLINIFWPLNLGKGNLNEGTLVYKEFVNPPVTVSPGEIKRDAEKQSLLEIVVDSDLKWREEVILKPPAAFPMDIEQADALAAFVMPGVEEVVELVRRAMERSGEPYKRLGFPNMTPVKASEILYREIARSREPRYTWEPAPWSTGTKGQVIRLPRRILVEGEATCIDLALLLCSAIEHMRRLPVILGVCINERLWHVIPGVRVNDDDEEDNPLISNLDEVKNSCIPKRTVLFDPDGLIREREPRDADASARQLLEKATQVFLVDVQAARNKGIWPLPIADPPRVRPIPPSVMEEPLIMDYPEGVPDELAEEVARGRVVVLLGDVLDPEAALSSLEFARAMSNEAGLDEPDLLNAGSKIEKKYGRDTLVQIARGLLNSKGHDPTTAYRSFAQLSIQTVVSFYPDPMLEHLLLNQDPPFQLLIEDDDLAAFKTGSGNRVLYLLGGSAITGKGLVLTCTDHNHLLKRIEVLARGLRDRLALQTLLLIGGDMDDLNLKELYLEATKHLGSSRTRPIYVVSAANTGKWFEPCHILKQAPRELFEALSQVVPLPQPAIKPLVSLPIKEKKRSPYKYLDYFEPEDADLFFGREEDWSRISKEIMASPSRVTVLCGRSGVGKTSLVKARLIPRLEQDKGIITTYTRFGNDPETSIFKALQTHIIKAGIKEKITDGDIKAVLRMLFQKCHHEHVIFLDQTEEAFIKLGKELLDSFFSNIRECVLGVNTGTYVVFVIREDYLGRLAQYRDQFPGLLTTACLLQELTHESAREAIVKPAEICGLEVEDALVEEVLNDLSPDRILPSNLQVVCDRIYQESKSNALKLETYTKIGRAARILKGHLEEAMSRLPIGLESTARKILQAMVTSENTKDLLSLEQIVKRTQLSMKDVEIAVHDLMHTQRLLREVPGDPIRFELSHESLAVSFSEWLEEKELRIREIQEILDQEVSNSRKFKEFQFPLDKLRLIDEHKEYLDLDKDSINVVVKAFLKSGQLPKFWINKLKESIVVDENYEIKFEQFLYYSKDEFKTLISKFKYNNTNIIESALSKGVLLGSEYYVDAGIKLIIEIGLDNALSSIFIGLSEVTESRIEQIFKSCRTYVNKSKNSMVALNTLMENPIISEKLANEVLFGCSNLLEIIIEIIFMGSSRDTLAAVINGLCQIPDKRVELILRTFRTLSIQSKSFIDILTSIINKQDISKRLVEIVFSRSESLSEITMEIISIDSSGNTLQLIFRDLNKLPDERVKLIWKTCKVLFVRTKNFLDILRSITNKEDVSKMLVKMVFSQSESLSEIIIQIIFTGRSRNALIKMFRGFDRITDDKAEWILKICKLYTENHQLLLLSALEKQKLNIIFLNRITKIELHHWPSILRFLLENSGSEILKILALKDEPKVIQIILKFLRDNISSRLNQLCIEFIENVHEPFALIELLKALKNIQNSSKPFRNAILNNLDKNLKTLINPPPGIVELVIRSSKYFIDDEIIRLRLILRSCMPKVRFIVEDTIKNNNSQEIRHFTRLIFKEYDNSQRMSSK